MKCAQIIQIQCFSNALKITVREKVDFAASHLFTEFLHIFATLSEKKPGLMLGVRSEFRGNYPVWSARVFLGSATPCKLPYVSVVLSKCDCWSSELGNPSRLKIFGISQISSSQFRCTIHQIPSITLLGNWYFERNNRLRTSWFIPKSFITVLSFTKCILSWSNFSITQVVQVFETSIQTENVSKCKFNSEMFAE